MAGAKKPGPIREYGGGDSPWVGAGVSLDRPSVRPDFVARGGFEPETDSLWGIRLPWNQPGRPFFSDAGQLLDDLVGRLEHVADFDQLEELIKRILGPQCFALGVVYGAGEAFIVSIADLSGLVKTFVLADLYDATQRNPSSVMWQPGGIIRYLTAWALNEYFGDALHEAARERDALIAEVKAIFEAPGVFFEKLGEEYSEKFKRFTAFSADSSLESQFQAGRIFGEVLLDIVGLIAGGAAVVKGLSKIPRLARLGRLLKGKLKVRIKAPIAGEATVSGGPPSSAPRSAGSPKEPTPIVDDPPKKPKSLRDQYLGSTPGKGSATGQKVQARMRAEGKLRDGIDGPEFLDSNGEWWPLSKADMAHKVDAVKWWNEEGRKYGPKSKEVRDWMLDPNNYELDHYSINRSKGALLPDRYRPPQ